MEEIVDQHKESAEELLEKYDKESQVRPNIGRWGWVVTILGIYLTLFHLYTGYFGTLPSQKQGAIHLGTAIAIIFYYFRLKKVYIAYKRPFLGMMLYLPLQLCTSPIIKFSFMMKFYKVE